MIRILVVDDEPAAVERLCALLEQLPGVAVAGTAYDGESALKAIELTRPHLVMLDIQMPDLNGLMIASRLPRESRPDIVFVTAFEVYAADAFEIEALDYLLKPVRFDRLRQTIERAQRRRTAAERGPDTIAAGRALWVATRTGSARVSLSEIEWIEAAKDYVLLHTSTRSFLHRATMASLETDLADSGLVRVHRSAFVRTDRIREVSGHGRAITGVVLLNDIEVPVGSTYAPALSAALSL